MLARELLTKDFDAYAVDALVDPLKAGDKLQQALLTVAQAFEALRGSDLVSVLAGLRPLAPMFHALTVASRKASVQATAAKNAADLAKEAYKQLFAADGSLALSNAEEANALLGFVLDVVAASQAGCLTANVALATYPDAERAALAGYLGEAFGALTTHDSKSAHSSAQLSAACAVPPEPSRLLNSTSFEPFLSARLTGGPLKTASWLLPLSSFSLTVAGRSFQLIEVFTSADAREFLAAAGVTALANLPLVVIEKSAGFSARLVGQTQLRVPDEDSVALNLLPAHHMLKATAQLGARIDELASQRIMAVCREHVVNLVPADKQADVAAKLDAADIRPVLYKRAALLKLVNAVLKEAKVPGLKAEVLPDVWKLPAARTLRLGFHLSRVPTVGSNLMNCGNAYQSFVGKQGIYRFPAAPPAPSKPSSRHVRSFFMLARMLEDAVRKQLRDDQDLPALESRLLRDDKWLPKRLQRTIVNSAVEQAAYRYVRLVRLVAARAKVQEDTREQLLSWAETPLQFFVLHGAATDEAQLRELATHGIGFLKSADATSQSDFIDAVVSILQKEKLL